MSKERLSKLQREILTAVLKLDNERKNDQLYKDNAGVRYSEVYKEVRRKLLKSEPLKTYFNCIVEYWPDESLQVSFSRSIRNLRKKGFLKLYVRDKKEPWIYQNNKGKCYMPEIVVTSKILNVNS